MGERSREENIYYFEKLKAYYGMFLESLAAVPESIEAYSGMQTYMEWAQDCIDVLKRK